MALPLFLFPIVFICKGSGTTNITDGNKSIIALKKKKKRFKIPPFETVDKSRCRAVGNFKTKCSTDLVQQVESQIN